MSRNFPSEFEPAPPKETNIRAKHAVAGGHVSELEEVHDTRKDCIANFYRIILINLSFVRVFFNSGRKMLLKIPSIICVSRCAGLTRPIKMIIDILM